MCGVVGAIGGHEAHDQVPLGEARDLHGEARDLYGEDADGLALAVLPSAPIEGLIPVGSQRCLSLPDFREIFVSMHVGHGGHDLVLLGEARDLYGEEAARLALAVLPSADPPSRESF
jgi:hypothetical protein